MSHFILLTVGARTFRFRVSSYRIVLISASTFIQNRYNPTYTMSRSKASLVWEFFNEAHTTGTCKTCGTVIKRPLSNTSNLVIHLKRHHSTEYQQLLRLETEKKDDETHETESLKRKQPTIVATFQ